ncbi:MAG TPA: hypothetical protein VN132_10810 [Bdellovibrio sp.]|nr:hypothetical protein [Bdellovibrio sp.]
MSLSNLIQWCVGAVIAWSAIAHIDDIQHSILKAQAVLIYESRASNWGSPKFLSDLETSHK